MLNQKIKDAFGKIDRAVFIHEQFSDLAYQDTALPIEENQTISQPSLMALMTHHLDCKPHQKILEIGTGCGYQAAILAQLKARVYSIERIKTLYDLAQQRLKLMKCNVTMRYGDGMNGWPEVAPFDRIILTANAEKIPEILWDELKEGGVMILPIGHHKKTQDLIKISKINGVAHQEKLTSVRFVPLVTGKK